MGQEEEEKYFLQFEGKNDINNSDDIFNNNIPLMVWKEWTPTIWQNYGYLTILCYWLTLPFIKSMIMNIINII